MRIVTIQDISCFGGCSATAALPTLTSKGIEVAILPSGLLSTHTGFKNAEKLDLTSFMEKTIDHWISLNIKFDAIYVGYICNSKQFELILKLKDTLLKENGLFFVDPAMADRGHLYSGLDSNIISGMKKLCEVADYIFPNITEACILTDIPYQEEYDDDFLNLLLKKLSLLGSKNVILTGVVKNNRIGAIYYDGANKEIILGPKDEKSYFGTGDIFTSVVIGEILNDSPIKDAISKACNFVLNAIKLTKDDPSRTYGVKLESLLKK